MGKPILIKAGSNSIGLGVNLDPPKVDCRVVAEHEYKEMLKLINDAKCIVEASKKSANSEWWLIKYNKWISNV